MMLVRRILRHIRILRSGLATHAGPQTKPRSSRVVRFISYSGCGVVFYYAGAYAIYKDSFLPAEAPVTLSFESYRLLPLNLSSRVVGVLAALPIPEGLRAPLYGLFARRYGVKMDEAEFPDFRHYPTFSAFFRRSLKPGLRPVDTSAGLNCPCDGRVLYLGEVENGQLEQIKGIKYQLTNFFGDNVSAAANLKKGNRLFHIILYLSPGDYHRFHTPIDWTITSRRYFPGYLLSVKPRIAEKINGLFCINERSLYFGNWRHGFFSYTAVGATNVGTINVFYDKELTTNIGRPINGQFLEACFQSTPIDLKRGQLFGEFNLGSTIVLIFEAPEDFKFRVAPGEIVKCGQALA